MRGTISTLNRWRSSPTLRRGIRGVYQVLSPIAKALLTEAVGQSADILARDGSSSLSRGFASNKILSKERSDVLGERFGEAVTSKAKKGANSLFDVADRAVLQAISGPIVREDLDQQMKKLDRQVTAKTKAKTKGKTKGTMKTGRREMPAIEPTRGRTRAAAKPALEPVAKTNTTKKTRRREVVPMLS